MSFLGDLFGGGDKPASVAPQPTSAAPRISDAEGQSAALEEASRLKNRGGGDKTILTSALGDSSAGASNISRTSALGGNSSIS
jgi:hypothetical protein